jgi:hypothetical protein
MTATEARPDPSEHDRTIEDLVPRSTRARDAALLLAALAAIAVVWWSPRVLRPSLGDFASGNWSALPTHRQVLVVVRTKADGLRGVDVRRVVPVPGASVAGAWILGADAVDDGDIGDEGAFPSGLAYAQALHPDIGPRSALPQRIADGSTVALAILWNIDDCRLLPRSDRDARFGVDVELRTLLRTRTTQTITALASPGWHDETLVEGGICPGG